MKLHQMSYACVSLFIYAKGSLVLAQRIASTLNNGVLMMAAQPTWVFVIRSCYAVTHELADPYRSQTLLL